MGKKKCCKKWKKKGKACKSCPLRDKLPESVLKGKKK